MFSIFFFCKCIHKFLLVHIKHIFHFEKRNIFLNNPSVVFYFLFICKYPNLSFCILYDYRIYLYRRCVCGIVKLVKWDFHSPRVIEMLTHIFFSYWNFFLISICCITCTFNNVFVILVFFKGELCVFQLRKTNSTFLCLFLNYSI